MDKLLIVGGFGFIGKNLVEYLYEKYNIVIIDKKIDKEFFIKFKKELKFYQYDFITEEMFKLHKIIEKENPNYIINLISIVTTERNLEIFEEMIKINLNVLLKLFNCSKKLSSLKLFIQFGSGEEYGNILPPFKETDRENPNSPYALAKQLTTNSSIMLNKNYDFPIVVVRPGNLFGKYQNANKFIPYTISQLLKNEEINITLGEQKRDFIYTLDFSRGIELLMENYKYFIGEIVNLSSGKSISLKEIVLFSKEYIKSNSKINFGAISYRENEIKNFLLDISKFEKGVKQKFEIDIMQRIKEYIDYLKGD
ncbi:NAD-dependent epimerase/dehydratase [uncultured spirochete]|uniref:NAD-dependent epimerase/dehydratase n=1 Tax=uncultured spirochete TaxID=156406 RepID=A0A3P3XGT9_9SPIR|nr:NAD-dependent epimerase/dehydratase [uncultured spirochete]